MRILKHILLSPITLILSIVVALLRLLYQLSNFVLTLVAFLVLAIGLCVVILMQNTSEGYKILGLAFVISPFGIPLITTILIELLGGFNELLKEI
jgi:hypothetical protein